MPKRIIVLSFALFIMTVLFALAGCKGNENSTGASGMPVPENSPEAPGMPVLVTVSDNLNHVLPDVTVVLEEAMGH